MPLRPARATGAGPAPGEDAAGRLHVYKASRRFSEREVRFCEVLAGFLASYLQLLRSRRALEAENSRLRVGSPRGDDELIGDSAAMASCASDRPPGRRARPPCSSSARAASARSWWRWRLHRGSPRPTGRW